MIRTTITVDCADITKVWRGYRGTGDLMARRAALQVHVDGMDVNFVGSPEELAELGVKVAEALAAELW